MEFNDLKEAIKYSKVSPMQEMVVPSFSVIFKTLRDVDIIKKQFVKGGEAFQETLSLECPQYLLKLVIHLLTKKSSAFSLLSDLSPPLCIKSINEIIHNNSDNLYLCYYGKSLVTMVPDEYIYLPNEFVLSGFINNDSKDNFVSALVCDTTRFVRVVYTVGDVFNTQFGSSKLGICIINSEVGIINPRKLSPISIIGFPCIWYEDKRTASILPPSKYPSVAVRQIKRKKSDIIFDFMVELELRKIYESVEDKHSNMFINKLTDKDLKTIKSMLRKVDPNINKKFKVLYESGNIANIYLNILNMTSLYNPQYAVKLEHVAGHLYSLI